MDKNSFGRMMDNPWSLTPAEWEELRRERDKYPFCAPLQVVSLMADKAGGAVLWEKQALPVVSLYVQDVERLLERLEKGAETSDGRETVAAEPKREERQEVKEHKEEPLPEGYDVLQEINAYQDVSFKTAPKSVILSNFLEKDGGIMADFDSYNDVSVQELAKNSLRPSDSFESETLAVILEKQGKLQQALEMYEKLLVNNPEKSSIFAVRIAALKAQLGE